MKLYKIRDIKTGLFSTGGRWPSWNKNGKIWSSVGPLKASLNMHSKVGINNWEVGINNWEVVVYDVFEVGKLPASDAKHLKNK